MLLVDKYQTPKRPSCLIHLNCRPASTLCDYPHTQMFLIVAIILIVVRVIIIIWSVCDTEFK